MSLWRQLVRGGRVLVNRGAADRELNDEVQHYLAEATAAHVARGMDPVAARRAAQLELGNTTVVRERVRGYGWENAVGTAMGDVRYAVRRLRSNPGFAIVSALTLALGIGATTAIFSAINPILFEALPYPNAGRLVTIADRGNVGAPFAPTFGTFVELRARSRSFEGLAATDRWEPSITGTNEPERLHGERVSANYFRVLGSGPAVGRDFLANEDVPGGPNVVVLSDRLARRRFGGASSVVGRQVLLDGIEYLVIGVMPPRFSNVLSPTADVWAPLQDRTIAPFNSREWGHHYQILGRLRAGISMDGARAEMAAIGKAALPQFPRPSWADMSNGLAVQSLRAQITGEVRPALMAIVGAVMLLLVIACVNVTNLLLARGAQRRSEFAMRVALGASRERLLRQVLTESVVLAMIGGVLGLGVAQIGVHALLALSPAELPRVDAIGLDAPVFIFAFAATALIGLAVGFIPALGAARAGLHDELQRSSRRAAGSRGGARRLLVVAEVALALVLLVGAGLLMRSLARLFAVDPGFRPSHLLTMQVVEAGLDFHSDTARKRFFDDALDAVTHVPGVTSAALTSQVPLSDDLDAYGVVVATPGPSGRALKPGEDPTSLAVSALRYVVTPGYFRTMGVPLVRGRLLEPNDATMTPEAVVISESLARQQFGNQDPIGQRIRMGPEIIADRPWDIVVGVVGEVKQQSLALGQTEAFYVAMGRWWWVDNVQSFVVRTATDPAALAPSIKRAIWSVNPNQPIERVTTMDALIERSASQRRFALVVIESFALAALALAAIGIYGVLSGSVSERLREIGVRSALGASRERILGLVVGQGMSLTAIGIVLGIGGAFLATRALMSLLFGVSRLDPATYVGVALLLGLVSLVACALPAWRAARVDPAITLRAE